MTALLSASVHPGEIDGNGPVASFIGDHAAAQIYHSPAWARTIVNEVGGEELHVIVRDEASIVAWMHLLVADGPVGRIANSNPYYGSNGGILATSPEAFDVAAEAAMGVLREREVLACNIVEPMEDAFRERYTAAFPVVAGTKRVAHVKEISDLGSEERLLETVDGLTRSNLKRRCARAGIEVERDDSDDAIDWLLDHHRAQMKDRGVVPKERSFFEEWRDLPPSVGDPKSRLYVARLGRQRVAALYVRTWRDWVEYVTPVFDLGAREHQPLTAVIFAAILDCACDGFRRWSFGASGADLDGVHAFKQRWGGRDMPYDYHLVDLGGAQAVRDYVHENGTAGYGGYFLYPLK